MTDDFYSKMYDRLPPEYCPRCLARGKQNRLRYVPELGIIFSHLGRLECVCGWYVGRRFKVDVLMVGFSTLLASIILFFVTGSVISQFAVQQYSHTLYMTVGFMIIIQTAYLLYEKVLWWFR